MALFMPQSRIMTRVKPLLGDIVDALARYSVAVVVAGGNVEVELGIIVLEVAVDEGYGGGAVDVVVAVDHNSFL